MTNYPLRLPEHIMSAAKELAAKNGASLNQFLGSIIAERIGEMRAFDYIERRAERGNAEAALAILARAPDLPPLPGDEIEYSN
jgi:hypothetical protein